MKSLLTIRHIKVENANAIAGMTWGFPAVSNFLGFTHALSRKLESYCGLTLGACAVVCHSHQVHAHQPGGQGDYVFSLTRNPLTKEGATPSFNEEGRMHMEVSLVIECNFKYTQLDFDLELDDDEKQIEHLIEWLKRQVVMLRLAGGTILDVQQIEFDSVPNQDDELVKFERKKLLRLLPGYLLIDRNDLLQQHHERRIVEDKHTTLLDSWLDFISIKYGASVADDVKIAGDTKKTRWERLPRPSAGWLVPITTGFAAVAPLCQAGEVQRTRDSSVPFQYVESVYSIGQWISPHRISELSSIFWRYQYEGDSYLCVNNYSH